MKVNDRNQRKISSKRKKKSRIIGTYSTKKKNARD